MELGVLVGTSLKCCKGFVGVGVLVGVDEGLQPLSSWHCDCGHGLLELTDTDWEIHLVPEQDFTIHSFDEGVGVFVGADVLQALLTGAQSDGVHPLSELMVSFLEVQTLFIQVFTVQILVNGVGVGFLGFMLHMHAYALQFVFSNPGQHGADPEYIAPPAGTHAVAGDSCVLVGDGCVLVGDGCVLVGAFVAVCFGVDIAVGFCADVGGFGVAFGLVHIFCMHKPLQQSFVTVQGSLSALHFDAALLLVSVTC